MRRLRPLLPGQARGRGHGRNSFHRYRLQAARRQDVPMHRLSAPSQGCSRLREADGGRGPSTQLASRHLRLSVGGQGTGPPSWHPLVSGSPDSVQEAGVSVRGRVWASESDLAPELWPDRIVKWPNRKPRPKRVRLTSERRAGALGASVVGPGRDRPSANGVDKGAQRRRHLALLRVAKEIAGKRRDQRSSRGISRPAAIELRHGFLNGDGNPNASKRQAIGHLLVVDDHRTGDHNLEPGSILEKLPGVGRHAAGPAPLNTAMLNEIARVLRPPMEER